MSVIRNDGWVKSATGPAVPGAQIYICTQPANVGSAPPTPLATIYSDPNGLVPITQPILTDGFGHYDFYIAPGTYTLVVALGGVIQQVYADQTYGAGPTIKINGAPSDSQTVINFINTTTVIWNVDGSGNISAELEAVPRAIWSGAAYAQVNDTNVAPGGFNNDVFGYHITIPVGTSVRQVTQRNFNLVPGSSFTIGIYDKTGQTLLFTTGANAFDGNVSGDQTVTAPSADLPAGEYVLAFGSTDASKQYRYGFALISGGTMNLNGATFFFKAAAQLSGGAMPASLGALTASSLVGWPDFLLQP